MNDEIDALRHEIKVLRQQLSERESNVRFLYAKLKKLCFAMIASEMGTLDQQLADDITQFIRDVSGWPPHPEDLFKI